IGVTIMNPRVIAVEYVGDYKLEITFSDGTKGILDWETRLQNIKAGGIFEQLRNKKKFARVEVWDGTIRWPNDADVCPDVLYEEISRKITLHGELTESMNTSV
ncbi:MAG: DUF2442 domain-containing protein, partial [bacterium]